ncbi:MAG: translation elongation factor Ts [Candidatus Hatepunaea meridiana]|nr:translation elongation factor Ts [Candidatus Hatepunaea meridiana]
MSSFTSKDVVTLRKKTGLGMMDCKRALEASEGDYDKAIEFLRKKGISKGESRSERPTGQGLIEAYIHPGERLGVIIELLCETDFVSRSDVFKQLAHDIAMQVAASAPRYVRKEDIPKAIIEKELEIYREQIKEQNKPPDIVDRIAQGKLNKFIQENCLIEQDYIKENKVKVKDEILSVAGKLKENIQIRRFVRYTLGE